MSEEIDLQHLKKMKESFLEEIFLLTYKLSMNYSDVWNMSISKRKWFVSRLFKQLELESTTNQQLPPIPNLPR